MKFRIYFLALLTIAALTFQCGIFEPEDSSGSLRITMVKKAAKSIQPKLMASFASVQCILRKGSGPPEFYDLIPKDGRFHGEIKDLEPADNYSVLLYGKDGSGQIIKRTYKSGIRVRAGEETPVNMPSWTTVTPILNSPANGDTLRDNTPSFNWSDVSSPSVYELMVDNSSSFGSPEIHETNLPDSNYTASSLLSDDTYYWKVRAKDSNGNWGGWSEVWSFTVSVTEIVSTPTTPSDPTSGKAGESLCFSTSGSTSSKGHNVEYRFDWGDGSFSSWGASTQCQTYTVVGYYTVKAQARCQTHTSIVSDWSSGLPVTISGHTLSVSVSPSGSGSVTKNLDKTEYDHDEVVQLTAVPNSGYQFDRWEGDLSGDSNPDSLTMNGDKTVTAYFKQLVWHEDFESYSSGSFPSPTWTPDANASNSATNYIDNTIFYKGIKSLRLHGTLGGCWAALAYRPLTASPPYEIEVVVRNGNESPSGCHPNRASIGIRKGFSSTNPGRTFITFTNNGTILGANGRMLGTYSTLTWYTVRARYERPSASEVKVSYWINNTYLGSETLQADPEEDQITNLDLTVGEGTAWFDAVKVFK